MLTSSSRPSPSESTSSATEKTKTANSDSFSSNPESTVCQDTTSLLVSSLRHGDTRALRLRHLWHRHVLKLEEAREHESQRGDSKWTMIMVVRDGKLLKTCSMHQHTCYLDMSEGASAATFMSQI